MYVCMSARGLPCERKEERTGCGCVLHAGEWVPNTLAPLWHMQVCGATCTTVHLAASRRPPPSSAAPSPACSAPALGWWLLGPQLTKHFTCISGTLTLRLGRAQAERMFDRRILLVPAIDGYEKQAFVDLTLAPFSTKPVRGRSGVEGRGGRGSAGRPALARCRARARCRGAVC